MAATCTVQGCKHPATHRCDAPGCSNETCDQHTAWRESDEAPSASGGDSGASQPTEGYCPRHVYLAKM